MEFYWKAAAAVLIVLILGQAIPQKDLSLVLTMTACVLVGLLFITYLTPIIDFLKTLQKLGDIQGNMLEILLKVLGIGIVTQLTQLICKDSGNASLGQALNLLGTAVILWLSLPVFTALIEIIQKILGEV